MVGNSVVRLDVCLVESWVVKMVGLKGDCWVVKMDCSRVAWRVV